MSVQVRKVIAAHDVGRAINPLTLEGQIEGGIVMCIGYALTEHYIQEQGNALDQRDGALQDARYQTHTQPSSRTSWSTRHPPGHFGAKGVGELPSIPTSAAITNAIYNATGVRVRSLPVDQDELLRAMRSGAKEVELGWGHNQNPSPCVTLGGENSETDTGYT